MTDDINTSSGDDTPARSRTRSRVRRAVQPAEPVEPAAAVEAPAEEPPAAQAAPDASTDEETDEETGARRRRRRRAATPADSEPEAESPAEAAAAPTEQTGAENIEEPADAAAPRTRKRASRKPAKTTRKEQPTQDEAGDEAQEAAGEEPAVRETRQGEETQPEEALGEASGEAFGEALGEASGDASESAAEADTEGRPASRRRSRRGGRGRRRRTATGLLGERGEADLDDARDLDATAVVDDVEDVEEIADGEDEGPTRLQSRRKRPRAGAARGGRTGRAQRPLGGLSEEARRAIQEAPPKRMLVSVGAERTQIAVLEERKLVEHYVTRRSDISYVGNIYLGRVQNVLPGMEAAFVDIGKGRNGVLYAGEVNYDEADLEGELPRIEQTLKPGQTALVQVTKDPMGTKGARLTQQLSLAGRYCVLAPGDGMLGISRKLPDEERERLRKILKAIKPEDYGLIVRTAAEGATREQLEADVARLVRIWEQVRERVDEVKPLEPVYEEPDLVIRVIRDVFGPEYSDLVVDSPELGKEIRDYLGDVSPDLVDKVALYEGDGRLFDEYEVTNQIRRALEKKVWLASGGYLIVEKTEAMWVIDVNTGKFVGERNLEETVLRNNIEAAVEIARQLRLRDMGGIIVIDFVDMLVPANRDEVLKRFRRELARDRTKSRVMEISKLGLVQMTRKNVSQGLQEVFMTRCEHCEGRGAVMVDEILA